MSIFCFLLKNFSARTKAVREFCFPENITLESKAKSPDKKTKPIKTEELLRNENTFVFVQNGLGPDGRKIHDGNRSGWIYCICYKLNIEIKVFFIIQNNVQKKGKDGKIISAPKVLCFMTYFEYFEFFYHTMRVMNLLSGFEQKYSNVDLSNDAKILLNKLLETDVLSLNIITVPPIPKINQKAFSYLLPKSDCSERSGIFFCGLLFSVLKPHDIFEIICNILLEHSIVFVSKNANLLTSAILGCCALISPFKWEHPIIPIVPYKMLELLEAPVPFLVGMLKSNAEGLGFTKDIWCQQTVIVLLDTGKIHICPSDGEISKLVKTPSLGGLEKVLEPYFISFEKNRKKATGLCYHPTAGQLDAMTMICRKIRIALEKIIVEGLPKEGKRKGNGVLDITTMGGLAVEKSENEYDREFLKRFGETQMFATFLEEKYK